MRHSTAGEIDRAVRGLYQKNGYVVLSEVRNGTGYEKRVRTADMIAVSTWPSRGLFLEGLEIKVSRSDLSRELAQPEKADALARYCTYWWIAVPDDLITPEMMIPETWGIVAVNEKGKASVSRKAARLSPEPLDALLLCSILRNFAESYVHCSELEPRIAAARKDGEHSARIDREYRLKELEGAVADFQKTSGINLMGEHNHRRWDLGNVGEAVRLICTLKGRPLSELADAKAALIAASSAIDAALSVMDRPLVETEVA